MITIFFGCNNATEMRNEYKEKIRKELNTKGRIIGKEYDSFNSHGYEIIEIDGHEYISTSDGGICPLIKDSIN